MLDLSRLTFIDCIGLRAIIAFARRARAGGWRLRIVSPAPSVARIFALTDTAQSLPLTEPMTDDQVSALLASQPHSETLPHPAATVAILRRHVEDATDDLGAVERWIAGQSGQRHIGAPTKSLTHRTGSARPHYDGPFPYYIIPAEALVEPVLSPPNLVRLDERIGAIAHGHGSYASGAKPA